jgi:SHS2 domain-containing protein
MSYEFLEHTADVKFRAKGASLEDMFVSASEALNETVRGDIKILERSEKSFNVDVSSVEELLYDFLEEFIVFLDSEDFLVSKIKSLEIRGNSLKCIVLGDEAKNYKFTNDVKAVTYSDMVVDQRDGKFICEVVLDV